jgi:hypothetical protein
MQRRWQKPILLLLTVLFVSAAAFLQKDLNRQRTKLGLTRVEPLENAPPVLAFTTVALGSFRGLIANALWVRANELQMEDKFFEQVQLADWITKLEPHFVQVWLVQAWNMAYNISVKFRDPADRWRWVRNGIELLRDQGIPYNPKEALIYRELAWFFQHKIGQNLDEANAYYKFAWAKEMTQLFGGPRPNFEELLNPTTDEARARLKVVRDVYKMEPALMKKAEDAYGPLEWRLPDAHAIYWATVGLERSNQKDQLTLRRNIYQSLHMCVLRGRIVLARPDGSYVFAPDLSKIQLASDGYEKMIAEESENPDLVRRAHRGFLKEAIYLLYNYNRTAEANRWMTITKQKYPDAFPPDETVESYSFKRLTDRIRDVDQNRTKALIEGWLNQHFENLILDEDDRAAAVLRMAKQIWDYYDSMTKSRAEARGMEPFPDIYRRVRDALLDPASGLPPEYAARLRTKLNLPALTAPETSPPNSPAPK